MLLLFLPPTPSVGDKVTTGLVSSQLVGCCCFSFVSFFGVLAGCTGVSVANVKAMAPTVVHVCEESGAPVASGGSGATFAGGLIGGLVVWRLDGCKCRSVGWWLCRSRGPSFNCCSELRHLLAEGCKFQLV